MVSYLNLLFCLNFVLNYVKTESDFEFYSATEHLKILLDSQDKLIQNLEKYLVREKKRHYVLTKYLKRYKHDYYTTIKNPKQYFGNPINVFTFLKRLTVDVTAFEKKIVDLTPYTILSNLTFNLPSEIDVNGVTKGLVRLQSTYKLNITDLANGVLKARDKNGEWITESVTPLSVLDLFDMGNVLFRLKDYKTALPWVLEAYHRFKPQDHDMYPFKLQKIIEFISFCYNYIGDFETEVSWLQLMVNLDPDNDRAVALLGSRKRHLDFERTQAAIGDESGKPEESKEVGESKQETEMEMYQSLCRGDRKVEDQVIKKLKCRYLTEIHPYFTIGPIKLEHLHISPNIYRFHDIINDKDIQEMRYTFRERIMNRENMKHDFESQATNFRVSKSTNLDDKYKIANKISVLVSDITALDTKYSDPLKVTNYGFAGYQNMHQDFFQRYDKKLLETEENNKVTFLFYLSNVELGGATVFLDANLTVYPKAGDAIYFENVKTNEHLGELYADCPVLKGEKWTATKWISEVGNEFRRQCYEPKREA